MYAGIDLGTTYVKTHTGIIFPSGISTKFTDMASNVMTVDGLTYAMELMNDKAEYGVNVNKSLNINARLNYLYALYLLAHSDESIFRSVVVGLPAGQWKIKDSVEAYKNLLNQQEPIMINVNGKQKLIQVDNINIVPEGATAYYLLDYKRFEFRKVLLIDIGGLTVNTLLFSNNDLIDVETFEDGVLKVYQEMASEINNHLGTNLKIEDMFEILTKGYYHKGQQVDIKPYIDFIGINYCERIYKKLRLRWGIDSIKHVPLIGAGSITMNQYLKLFIPEPQSELQKDAQILAAKGMETIARECA